MDQDPADPQSWNIYSYVRNRPLNHIDPTGQCSKPAGLEEGDVGICIASFIARENVGDSGLKRFAFGDNRGPVGDDASATFRQQTQIILRADGSIEHTSEAGISEFGTPGFPTAHGMMFASLPGQQETSVETATDKAGNTIISVSSLSINGFTAREVIGSPGGEIVVNIDIKVTPEGAVGIAGGNRTAFPSLEVFRSEKIGSPSLIGAFGESNAGDLRPVGKKTGGKIIPIPPVDPRK